MKRSKVWVFSPNLDRYQEVYEGANRKECDKHAARLKGTLNSGSFTLVLPSSWAPQGKGIATVWGAAKTAIVAEATTGDARP